MIQDRQKTNLAAARSVADYLLFVNCKAMGVVEAKAEGSTLSGVAEQSAQYLVGLPANILPVQLPLPFAYESTGVETYFRSLKDPQPRSRRVFAFHRVISDIKPVPYSASTLP